MLTEDVLLAGQLDAVEREVVGAARQFELARTVRGGPGLGRVGHRCEQGRRELQLAAADRL